MRGVDITKVTSQLPEKELVDTSTSLLRTNRQQNYTTFLQVKLDAKIITYAWSWCTMSVPSLP
jgi:hypothetical protein